MTTVDDRLQILPRAKHTIIGLHHRPRFGPLEAIALELADQVVEDQSVGTFGTVLRQHTNEQEVDDGRLVPLQNLEQMPPAEGEQTTVARLLQSP